MAVQAKVPTGTPSTKWAMAPPPVTPSYVIATCCHTAPVWFSTADPCHVDQHGSTALSSTSLVPRVSPLTTLTFANGAPAAGMGSRRRPTPQQSSSPTTRCVVPAGGGAYAVPSAKVPATGRSSTASRAWVAFTCAYTSCHAPSLAATPLMMVVLPPAVSNTTRRSVLLSRLKLILNPVLPAVAAPSASTGWGGL